MIRVTLRSAALAAAVACLPSLAAAAPPSARATVDGVSLVVTLPAEVLSVNDVGTFVVAVDGKGAVPLAVRARLGMPEHGHWITEELRQPYAGAPLEFPGSFPMTGRYRLRLWIELADHEGKIAVDFAVPGSPVVPEVAP